MKKLLGKIYAKTNEAYIAGATLCRKAKSRIFNNRGEGYIDTAIKIIICVVVGALVLAGLVALWNLVIMPRLNREVTDMFG